MIPKTPKDVSRIGLDLKVSKMRQAKAHTAGRLARFGPLLDAFSSNVVRRDLFAKNRDWGSKFLKKYSN